jgi:hypothetical protein
MNRVSFIGSTSSRRRQKRVFLSRSFLTTAPSLPEVSITFSNHMSFLKFSHRTRYSHTINNIIFPKVFLNMTYDWDLIKPEIRESYVIREQRLVQVARAIRERYGFDIRSVIPQFS